MSQNRTYQNVMSQLEILIKQEVLTPTKRVDLDTFICVTELSPQGKMYFQGEFNTLPDMHKAMFFGRNVGDSFGPYKVVGVFDVWPEVMISPALAVRGH